MNEERSLYERIYALTRQIPVGKVVSYGQLADQVGCGARTVGYAMSALRSGAHPDVPWQRVVNRKGRISIQDAYGGALQRQLLEEESVIFDEKDQVDFSIFGWWGEPG